MPNVNISLHKGMVKYIDSIIDCLKELNINNITFNRISDYEESLAYEEFDKIVNKFEKFNVRNTSAKSVDCRMYGKKCGVGSTNIYYSGKCVYPCGRFIDKEKYVIGYYNDSIETIWDKMNTLIKNECKNCYYEENVL